jgi:hypothetical protein
MMITVPTAELSVTVTNTSGSEIPGSPFTGDAAQAILSFVEHSGSNFLPAGALSFVNVDCICNITTTVTTGTMDIDDGSVEFGCSDCKGSTTATDSTTATGATTA